MKIREAPVLGEAFGECLGLQMGPADLLLDPPQVGMDLGGDRELGHPVLQHHVDHAAGRALDRDLQAWCPARVERADERLDDPRLEAVADRRPGVGEEPHGEVTSEDGGEATERLQRGLRPAALDPGEGALGEAGGARSCRGLRADRDDERAGRGVAVTRAFEAYEQSERVA